MNFSGLINQISNDRLKYEYKLKSELEILYELVCNKIFFVCLHRLLTDLRIISDEKKEDEFLAKLIGTKNSKAIYNLLEWAGITSSETEKLESAFNQIKESQIEQRIQVIEKIDEVLSEVSKRISGVEKVEDIATRLTSMKETISCMETLIHNVKLASIVEQELPKIKWPERLFPLTGKDEEIKKFCDMIAGEGTVKATIKKLDRLFDEQCKKLSASAIGVAQQFNEVQPSDIKNLILGKIEELPQIAREKLREERLIKLMSAVGSLETLPDEWKKKIQKSIRIT